MLMKYALRSMFGEANSPDYSVFKFESTRRGIASQALQAQKLAKTRDIQLAVNLCLKIKFVAFSPHPFDRGALTLVRHIARSLRDRASASKPTLHRA